jgi:hypothetical protein
VALNRRATGCSKSRLNPRNYPDVIYIFEKEKQGALRLETRYAKDSKTYEIIWRRADGTTTREIFNGETSFRSRLQEIQIELEDEEWRTVGPPHLLADGWKI